MPMVAPIPPRTAVTVVSFFVGCEMKKIIKAVTATSGTCNVIEMITHKTAPPARIAVRILRARVGASSRLNQPIQSESLGRASRKVALMELFPRRTFDDRDRGRAHAEQ